MFNIGMENKPYEYTIKHDGIRAPYVSVCVYVLQCSLKCNALSKTGCIYACISSLGGYEFGLEIESVLGKFEKTIYNDI